MIGIREVLFFKSFTFLIKKLLTFDIKFKHIAKVYFGHFGH